MKLCEITQNPLISDPKYESVRKKAKDGILVWRGISPYGPADPGDFGTGTYYSTNKFRAKYHGSTNGAKQYHLKFNNPIVLGTSAAYDLADQYNTLHGSLDERRAASLLLNNDLRKAGFDGLISVSKPVRSNFTELEIVDLRIN